MLSNLNQKVFTHEKEIFTLYTGTETEDAISVILTQNAHLPVSSINRTYNYFCEIDVKTFKTISVSDQVIIKPELFAIISQIHNKIFCLDILEVDKPWRGKGLAKQFYSFLIQNLLLSADQYLISFHYHLPIARSFCRYGAVLLGDIAKDEQNFIKSNLVDFSENSFVTVGKKFPCLSPDISLENKLLSKQKSIYFFRIVHKLELIASNPAPSIADMDTFSEVIEDLISFSTPIRSTQKMKRQLKILIQNQEKIIENIQVNHLEEILNYL